MKELNSNVKGFVEAIKRTESGTFVKIMTGNGEFHEYGNLSNVKVKEFENVEIGDPLGLIEGELSYFVKLQPRAI